MQHILVGYSVIFGWPYQKKFKEVLLTLVFQSEWKIDTHSFSCGRKPIGKTEALQRRDSERDDVSNRQPHNYLLNHLFRRRSTKISKLRVSGLCEGNLPVTGQFPAQRASKGKNIVFITLKRKMNELSSCFGVLWSVFQFYICPVGIVWGILTCLQHFVVSFFLLNLIIKINFHDQIWALMVPILETRHIRELSSRYCCRQKSAS